MGAVHLLHMAVHMTQVFLLAAEELLAVAHHIHHNDQTHRQNADGHQRHQRADGKHHAQYAHNHGQLSDHLRKALVQRLGDHIHIVGDAAEHLAVRYPVKIGHG